jgi:hypothetical protein
VGLETMFNKNIYICESKNLEKRWVVQAKNVEDATGVVLSACKEHLKYIESMHPDQDIDVDLRFTLVEDSVLEL